VQEAWLRLSRSDAREIENLGGWLTTVVARVSLNMLRSRKSRREEPLGVRLPEPIVDRVDGIDPEHEALLADSVGLALLVVLETLSPPERLAFVLHDIFAVPFDEIAPIVDRSPEAARQLASRARRRVQGQNTVPDADLDTQREIVDAFLAAGRDGDFDALLVVLETLSPAERLAFVLHDMFAVPFDEIAPIVDRTPEAARKLASRARQRIRGENTVPDADLETQRHVAEAFLAAAREGDFEALLEVLDPDVVLRADFGPEAARESREVRGARAVAGQALFYSRLGLDMHLALVNGAIGAVAIRDGQPFSVAGVTVRGGRIVELDFLVDPARLAQLDLTILEG
jgi:RNA polymerase sigma factor (sigma-70 family)